MKRAMTGKEITLPENILQDLIVGLMLPFVNKFLLWAWKRVTRFYPENWGKFMPFVFVGPVFAAVSASLPHVSNMFQVALFLGVLGCVTILVALIGMLIESRKPQYVIAYEQW